MAVVLYRPGTGSVVRGIECQSIRVDPYSFQQYLDDGWVYDPAHLAEVIPPEIPLPELRDMARKVGFGRWDIARRKTLEAVINAPQG